MQTPKWMCAWAGWREKTSRGPGRGVGRTVLGCQNTPSVAFIDLSFGPEASSFAAISSLGGDGTISMRINIPGAAWEQQIL